MKIAEYRKQFAQQLKTGLQLFQHRTRKDNDGDPLVSTFAPVKKGKKHHANSWDWYAVADGVTPVGVAPVKTGDAVADEVAALKAKIAELEAGKLAEKAATPKVAAKPVAVKTATPETAAPKVEAKPVVVKTDALAKARAAKAAKKKAEATK